MEKIKTYKFLILEDNPSDALLIKRELEQNWEDSLIQVISTPNELRIALKEIVWDVIISDYSMPQFTGYDALRIMHESDQNPLFFLMSGVIGEEMAADAMEHGARDYIDKNYPKRMVISIKKALADMEESKALQVTRKQLYRSEKKYRDIIDLAPVGYFQVIPDGSFLEVNNAFISMLGYSSIASFMESKNLTDLLSSKEELQSIGLYLDNTDNNVSMNKEVLLTKKDGSSLWVIITMQAIADLDANTKYYNGFAINISQQKDAENKMYQSLTRWQDTFNAITNVLMLVSKDFNVIEVNDAGCRLLGKDRDQIIGNKCFTLIHNTKDNPEFCPALKAAKSKKMESSEIEIDDKYYILTAWPIFDEYGDIIAYSHAIQDITQRHKAKIEIENYRNHLEELVESRTTELMKTNEELKKKNIDLENMQKLYIGREDRIKDLRGQIKELKLQLEKYRNHV